jgi:succinyl-CoA synthetase beta subunit
MRLTEQQGKSLLALHGVPVPRGGLVDDPGTARLPYPHVAKTQILSGGRGKRGGVRLVSSPEELRTSVTAFRAGTPELPPALAVLVEEALDIEREHYLAVVIDRERRGPVLLAHPHGGVEVESQAEGFLRLPLQFPGSISTQTVERVRRHLGLGPALRHALTRFLEGLWEAFGEEDCLLIEVNPLVLTNSQNLVAADARVVVDDSARYRHPAMPTNVEGSPFEQAVLKAGAVATELDGEVAVVTSGAGLGMCTVDLVAATGARPACLIDLGGLVFGGPAPIGDALKCVSLLRPSVLFVNVFLQAARCDDLALGLRLVREQLRTHEIIVRLRGHRALEAREILADQGVFMTEDLFEALSAASDAGVRLREAQA